MTSRIATHSKGPLDPLFGHVATHFISRCHPQVDFPNCSIRSRYGTTDAADVGNCLLSDRLDLEPVSNFLVPTLSSAGKWDVFQVRQTKKVSQDLEV